jgi:hypothetical protein
MLPPRPQHQSNPERRGSYRCPIGGARRQGHLRIGKGLYAVELLDESVGGFAVVLDHAPDCEVGAKLLFEIASTWVEVRVISLESQEPTTEPSSENVGKTYTRMGLMRLRDLDPWEFEAEVPSRLSWDRFKSMLVPLAPLKSTAWNTAVMILAVIAAGVVLIWVLEGSAPRFQAMRDEMHEAAAKAPAPRDPLMSLAAKEAPAAPTAAPSTKPDDKKSSASTDSEESNPQRVAATPTPPEAIPEKIIRLAQPAFVLRPEVTKLLSLSREQRDQLRQMFEEFHAAAVTVSGTAGSENSGDRLVPLGGRVLEILTAEQRRVLLDLLANTDGSPDSTSPIAPVNPGNVEAPTEPERPAGE